MFNWIRIFMDLLFILIDHNFFLRFFFLFSFFTIFVSIRLDSVNRSSLDDTDEAFSREVTLDCDTENDHMEDIEIHKVARVGCEPTVCPFDVEDGLGFPSTKLSKDTANHSPRTTASQMVSYNVHLLGINCYQLEWTYNVHIKCMIFSASIYSM